MKKLLETWRTLFPAGSKFVRSGDTLLIASRGISWIYLSAVTSIVEYRVAEIIFTRPHKATDDTSVTCVDVYAYSIKNNTCLYYSNDMIAWTTTTHLFCAYTTQIIGQTILLFSNFSLVEFHLRSRLITLYYQQDSSCWRRYDLPFMNASTFGRKKFPASRRRDLIFPPSLRQVDCAWNWAFDIDTAVTLHVSV